jgi:hypothetical protein
MTLDRFGEELYIGDIVVYADTNVSGDGVISLDVYNVIELIDVNTCIGQLMNGRYAGNTFYLTETTNRCAYMYESNPEPEEGDEDLVKPIFN